MSLFSVLILQHMSPRPHHACGPIRRRWVNLFLERCRDPRMPNRHGKGRGSAQAAGRWPGAWLRCICWLLLLTGCDRADPRNASDIDPAGRVKQNVTKAAYPLRSEGMAKGSPRELRVGDSAQGALDAQDSQLRDGSHYEWWAYTARRGERVTIAVHSNDFDPFLIVAASRDDALAILAEDDDGGGAPNARLTLEFPADGIYLFLVNSVFPEEVGGYSIRVERSDSAAEQVTSSAGGSLNVSSGGGDPSESYALLVGIDDYPGVTNDLLGPVADARIMREVLITRFGFAPENIVTLTDAQASRDEIIRVFRGHLGQAGADGLALFYYSGHGTQLNENVGLTPPLDPEADGRDEALVVWGRSGSNSVLVDDELGALLEGLTAGRALIVLDACYSGTGTRGGLAGFGQPKELRFAQIQDSVTLPEQYLKGSPTGPAAGEPASGRFSEALTQPRRHILLAASGDRELSWTARGWPDRGGVASVFTYFLAAELETISPSTTFNDLIRRVGQRTTSHTEQFYGVRQTPQVEGIQATVMVSDFLRGR